jgi:D-alanyl-D-alanine carboxypeptidase/D-alanyl-D-alanine-endopeptidase (penicillin-binding protein 4)
MSRVIAAVKKTKITEFTGIVINELGWEDGPIPDGWIWQDIGNYYGAAAKKLNWRENQFDVVLKSGRKVGEPVEIIGTIPGRINYKLLSVATSAPKGSGDNAYIYFPVNAEYGTVRGTIPVNESHFIISGALPPGDILFFETITEALATHGIDATRTFSSINKYNPRLSPDNNISIFHTELSPPLDSVMFWLNRKSINLYAEALLKTIAFKRTEVASSIASIQLIKDFWKTKGIDEAELNMFDGSGLSPSNRVTTHALATVLQYAKKQNWFSGFYNSLPEYNGMKMKSGTIAGAKGFTGYYTSKGGAEYAFAFLVNNYNGSSSTLVQKMYWVLDELK